jgi:hypothetical protein
MSRCPLFYFIVVTLTWLKIWLSAAPASANMAVLPYNMRFCPSWAEAHERSLADLNHGRPPYPVKWKGCIALTRGSCVNVVEQREESTEIIVNGKHWFTDELPDVIAGRTCPGVIPAERSERRNP